MYTSECRWVSRATGDRRQGEGGRAQNTREPRRLRGLEDVRQEDSSSLFISTYGVHLFLAMRGGRRGPDSVRHGGN